VKISCPACSAKYSIADEKVQDRLAKIRCRKCGTTIVIDGKVSPPNVYASDGASLPSQDSPAVSDPAAVAAAGGAQEYSVDFGDNDQRTLSMQDLIAAYNAGQVTSETFVWADGMPDWKPLGEVAEIVDALHAAAGSSPQAQPAPEPQEPAPAPAASLGFGAPSPAASFGAGAPAAATPFAVRPAAAAQPLATPAAFDAQAHARAAAKAGGGRGMTNDLFGSFETAGSEHDVATSASTATQVATGARNESSVLFSLSALTSAPSPSTTATATSQPSNSGHATREDSGLIDLKALTASSEPDAGAPAMGLAPAPLGLAPLGMGTPLGSHLGGVEAQIAPPPKNKTGLFIGGGIAVAAIAIAIAIVAVGGKEPAPVPQPTTVAAPAPAPTPTPTQETTTAKAPATGTASDEEKPPDSKTAATQRPTGYKRPAGGGTTKSTGGSTSPGDTSTTDKKPPPKKSGGCGCAPGDLQCAMACAAKGG
jgi:predicted Zn finger-like uncharacterized protein